MGLQALRKGYTPTPYHRNDNRGKHIALTDRAEEAAKYLSEVQWGTAEDSHTPMRMDKIINQPVLVNQGNISTEEMDMAIKKLKQRKCGGPDGTCIEINERGAKGKSAPNTQ